MFKNFIRITILFAILLMLQGCPPRICDPEFIEYAPISDSILALIPYQNGGVYKIQHSKGQVIEFTCDRKVEKKNQCYDCGNCIVFEENITTLKPDYLIDNVQIYLSNYSDENQFQLHFSFGESFFDIYSSEFIVFIQDSLNIGGVIYCNVFALTDNNHYGNYGLQHQLYADSLYYSAEKGIIRITMSNDEYYQRYED